METYLDQYKKKTKKCVPFYIDGKTCHDSNSFRSIEEVFPTARPFGLENSIGFTMAVVSCIKKEPFTSRKRTNHNRGKHSSVQTIVAIIIRNESRS